ncbi:Isopenicillin N epimerase component 1 [Diplogelasinospora grovesii]|uniref:Very long-chain fatty acid transport protein n=1 Tax=Diplogelasinospora grovesii TaxID=303347 RepID=A0AAN6S2T9_9PEZI|nr:Isopenicillin N epimerase component 1 [Diplogelasinospora grovesii]
MTKNCNSALPIAAGTAAGFAYLDAKLHLRKDLRFLRGRARIRREWARAAKEGRTSMYYFFETHAAALGDKEAIWSRTGCYSWKQLLEKANQYGSWFLSRGVRRGDLVALYMINSPDFLFAWVGLWAVGAAPAMINYHLTGKALVHCLGISGAKLVLMDGDEAASRRMAEVRSEVTEKMPGIQLVSLADVRDTEIYTLLPIRPDDEYRRGLQAWDPMALFYTSGTTGMPKGCTLPVVAAFGHGNGRRAGISPVQGNAERYYVCMPYYHGTGGINAIGQLMAGVTVCVAPRFSASNFWKDVRDSKATWFVYVGETLRYLLAHPPSPLDREHSVHSIYGNGLRPDVWKKFRDRFGITHAVWEFFNSTEGMLALDNPSCNDYTANAVGHHGFLQRWKYHRYYVPVAVDPETGDIARDPKTRFAYRMPYEIGGEILVAVPFERQFSGYWKNSEATENKFVRDVFRKGDCYYRTGDALRRDSEGRWFFLDRLGDTFRWKGENVSTAEVSEVLGKFPGVLEANVYGVEVPGHDGKAGTAAIYIDPALKESFDHQAFLRHARSHLPRYAVPMFLRHVDEPSSTHNNKQNKLPLKRDGVDPEKVKQDKVFWIERHGRGTTYIPFTRQDWEDLHIGKAKL